MVQRTSRLRIHLSPSLMEPVQRWITTFAAKEKNWAEYPFIEDSYLTITAPCFPFFLAYINRDESNEFDLRRLRWLGQREIERRLAQMQSSAVARYYQQALYNLSTIEIGEFLG